MKTGQFYCCAMPFFLKQKVPVKDLINFNFIRV